jgi:hypothetical protein
MATLRGPGTAASTRRSGTAGAIDEALKAIVKGFRGHGRDLPLCGQDGEFLRRESLVWDYKVTRLYHNVQPPDQGRHSQPTTIRWHRVR